MKWEQNNVYNSATVTQRRINFTKQPKLHKILPYQTTYIKITG